VAVRLASAEQFLNDFDPLPDDGRVLRLLSSLPLARDRPGIGYACAVAASLIGLEARFWLDPFLPPGFPFVTFFPVVIGTAFLFGLRPGICAAVLCALLSDYFFVPPFMAFSVSGGAGMAMMLYAFVVVVDIALVDLMQRALGRLAQERARSGALAEHREVLFRELQHRVGNNLQMIGSLLSLQKRKLADPAARAALDEAARRLGMIGRIQRQLYNPDGAQLGLRGFIQKLAADLLETCGRDGLTCTVEGPADLTLATEDAISLALIVAEAVANAIEHGFAEREHGHIRIVLEPRGPRLGIAIEDDGAGLPAGFDPQASQSLGLRIAHTLSAGLGGSFELQARPHGTAALVDLPRHGADRAG